MVRGEYRSVEGDRAGERREREENQTISKRRVDIKAHVSPFPHLLSPLQHSPSSLIHHLQSDPLRKCLQ